MFERFTDRARRVVVLAQEEARMLNHNSIRIVKASLHRQWAAEQRDLPSLAEKVRQLGEEVEQLRGLLRRHGIEPDEGIA